MFRFLLTLTLSATLFSVRRPWLKERLGLGIVEFYTVLICVNLNDFTVSVIRTLPLAVLAFPRSHLRTSFTSTVNFITLGYIKASYPYFNSRAITAKVNGQDLLFKSGIVLYFHLCTTIGCVFFSSSGLPVLW
jgi:hypothetical protein